MISKETVYVSDRFLYADHSYLGAKAVVSMNDIPIITSYLNSLYRLIRQFGASVSFSDAARANVESQIYACLMHWNDEEFINALLVIGKEEGIHYTPHSSKNPFIVVAIRNSMLETLNSVQYAKTGLSRHLVPAEMKRITQQAIRHFENADFQAIANSIEISQKKDPYGDLAEKYPLAWEALCWLGNCKEDIIAYDPVAQDNEPNYSEWPPLDADKQAAVIGKVVVALDGYSLAIDPKLAANMLAIQTGELSCLYFDSFKMLTRNIEKLLFVINFVLMHEGAFVTANYFVTNGYIERRAECLRPTSSDSDAFGFARKQALLTGNIGKAHRNLLQMICDMN